MATDPRAGQLAPVSSLVDLSELERAYYADKPRPDKYLLTVDSLTFS